MTEPTCHYDVIDFVLPSGAGQSMATTTHHVIGLTFHYDVIHSVLVTKRCDCVPWQHAQNQGRHNGPEIKILDFKFTKVRPELTEIGPKVTVLGSEIIILSPEITIIWSQIHWSQSHFIWSHNLYSWSAIGPHSSATLVQ